MPKPRALAKMAEDFNALIERFDVPQDAAGHEGHLFRSARQLRASARHR